MSDAMEKAKVLAATIEKKANEALAHVDREMAIMKWPNEFRQIMWHAIAAEASRRADQ